MPVTDEKMNRAKAAQAKYEGQLMAKENVVGVSIGQVSNRQNEAAIVVLVDGATGPLFEDQIPSELDGVPVVIRQIGKLEARYQAKRGEAGWV